jgi:hypothetical protein
VKYLDTLTKNETNPVTIYPTQGSFPSQEFAEGYIKTVLADINNEIKDHYGKKYNAARAIGISPQYLCDLLLGHKRFTIGAIRKMQATGYFKNIENILYYYLVIDWRQSGL